jgi:hypothetical protein
MGAYDGIWPPPGLVGHHSADVEEIGDGRWDAACRCGWESVEHEDEHSADVAADEHDRTGA